MPNPPSVSDAPSPLWAVAVAAAAVLAIAGALQPELRVLHYVCKPLATLIVAALVWRARDSEPRYRAAVLFGLVASTLGDVFLMLPFDAFVAGLASFLVAHLAYLYALTRRRGFSPLRWPWLAYAVLAGAVLAVLWPKLPDALRAPVVVYVVALAAMAAQAATVALAHGSRATLAAACGGASFVVSDALLAIDRFHTPLPAAPALVLASYWSAQYLIGRSVWQRRA
ncbi:MAG TPA: lysoplasmalogenase [Tahibacter sp.]|uniref:lysoplasmalogenase n=1 Tax=Tahibacter sp. TaxID=2056211 RepID=UPI002BC195FA|nr:lysoplasmalogenase [Tahibacter sp.]HSX60493.1 lysoplasmalogenase [Tahibacter sp.]